MHALLCCMSTKLSRMQVADVHAKEQLSYLYIFCQNCILAYTIHDFAVVYIFLRSEYRARPQIIHVQASLFALWMWVMKDIGECTYLQILFKVYLIMLSVNCYKRTSERHCLILNPNVWDDMHSSFLGQKKGHAHACYCKIIRWCYYYCRQFINQIENS